MAETVSPNEVITVYYKGRSTTAIYMRPTGDGVSHWARLNNGPKIVIVMGDDGWEELK